MNEHFPGKGRQFEFNGHFGSYINDCKPETYLKHLKIISDDYCMKLFLYQISFNQIAAIFK